VGETILNFIDLFSGAGGLSCGLEMSGMRCLLGADINKDAIKTFEHNHPHAVGFSDDIRLLDKKTLRKLTNDQTIHAVVGGPPCQGFSTVGTGDPNDKRNTLFREFVRIVAITKPYFVVIENVTGLLAQKNEKTLMAIIEQFNNLGYHLECRVLSSQHYGVPEKRRRTIIIGSRANKKIIFPNPSHDIQVGRTLVPAVTVGEALKDLSTTDGRLLNHNVESAAKLNTLDKKRLERIPEGRGIRYPEDERNYLPSSLKLNVNWEEIKEGRFRQIKYQRLDRTKPSPTIMTGRTSYYHPTEHRYLTAREAAKLQSFPNEFEFFGTLTSQWRQIGNAVPPLMGRAIGRAILQMYKDSAKNKNEPSNSTHSIKKRISDIRGKAFVYK